MELFTIISGTCSIVGLFISIFVATKVYKLSIRIDNSNKNKMKHIVIGEGGTIVGGSKYVQEK